MIRIGKYKPEHLENIEMKDFYLEDKDIKKRSQELASGKMPVHTLYDDVTGEVLCIVGFQEFWPGVAEVWTITSKNAYRHKMGFARAIKEGMDFYIKAMNLKRLQATCPSQMPCGDRWFEFLGFTKECLMKKFGPDGDDYYLFAKVF